MEQCVKTKERIGNIIKKQGGYIAGTLLMILCLYAPEFKVFPKYTWLLAVIGLALFATDIIKKRRIDKYGIILYGLCAFAAVFGICVVLMNQTNDFSFLVFQTGTVLSLFRNYLVIGFVDRFSVKNEKSGIQQYMSMYIDACVVCVVFTLAFIVFPTFRSYWLGSVIHSEYMDYFVYQYRYSLSGFAAFAYSSTFSIALIFNAFLLGKNVENKKCFRYLSTYVLLIVGAFFYGRITIVAIAISVILIAYITKLKKNAIKRIVLPLAIAVTVLVGGVILLAQFNESAKLWKDWAFAIIAQIFSKDGITDYSVVHMFEDMYFAVDMRTFLFGTGYFGATGKYPVTDVGFLREIIYFGILGCIANYLQPLLFIYGVEKHSKKDKALKALLVSVLLIFIVLEMKGDAYHRILLSVMPLYYLKRMESKKEMDRYSLEK